MVLEIRALDRNILAVRTTIGNYIGVVAGEDHEAEAVGVAKNGAPIEDAVAAAIFNGI